MSFGLFVLGVTVVIWGLILVTNSNSLPQQIGGSFLAALASLATAFSGRFWKDPVEHMQKFSAQQTRLQAAFIGYMNDVAKLRLAFEQSYTSGKMTIKDVEKFHKMSQETISKATQEMRVE